jgi:DNA (cytosine-5)-methyltransferase 1
LFTGIGGIDLAAEWAGFESIGQVEFADYPTKVLEKHWPNVPRWRDIRNVTGEEVRKRINMLQEIVGGEPIEKEEERTYIQGNDTVH